jgi:putative nucleotidyltransferase with HDIG domain
MQISARAHKLTESIRLTRLPSLPEVLLSVLDGCRVQETSLEQLAETIKTDPALTAKTLAVASATASGERAAVTSLAETLFLVGIDGVRNIANSSCVHQVFSRISDERAGILRRYWRHSLTCATVARALARRVSYPSVEEAYLGGLLHDVGQLILGTSFPTEYVSVRAAVNRHQSLVQLERKRFGIDHCEVGASLIRSWNLRSFLADAVLYHHESTLKLLDAHHLVKIVHLANLLSADNAESHDEPFAVADKLFGFTRALMSEMLAQASAEVGDVARSLEIQLETTATYAERPSEHIKKVELAKEVRNIALLDGVCQHLTRSSGPKAILASIRQGASVLFGIPTVMFFLCEPGEKFVVGATDEEDTRFDQLQIPIEQGRSLATQALLSSQAVHSFSEKDSSQLSIIDRQLIGLSRKEGILCLPMKTGSTMLGVIVLGVDKLELPRVEEQLKLMLIFAGESALALKAHYDREANDEFIRIKDRTQHEDQARQVIHEASNPLSIINNYLKILGDRVGDTHPAQVELKIINEELDRVGNILLRLSEPSTQPRLAGPSPVNLQQSISELVRLFQVSLLRPHHIELELRLDDLMPPVITNLNALKQVLTNLIKNAVEAMPNGGTLALQTRDQVNFNGREYVELSISDTGPGIPAHIRPKLFEPVVSTKGRKHAGLGLTIVKNLVKELNAFITCHSDEKSGTTLRILIPRVVAESRDQ